MATGDEAGKVTRICVTVDVKTLESTRRIKLLSVLVLNQYSGVNEGSSYPNFAKFVLKEDANPKLLPVKANSFLLH